MELITIFVKEALIFSSFIWVIINESAGVTSGFNTEADFISFNKGHCTTFHLSLPPYVL